MKAVILAAGLGKRLRPYTFFIPKPLLKVGKKPIIIHTLNNLPEEIKEVIIVIGYLSEKIKKLIGEQYGKRKITYILQKEKKGTAHALWLCQKHLKGEKFLVLNGDDLYAKKDLEKCIKCDLCILAMQVKVPQKYGVIQLGKDGALETIQERPKNPPNNLVNIGAYVLDERIFSYEMAPINKKEFGLPQTIVKLAQDYPVKIITASFWRPVSYWEDLRKANE